MITVGDFLNPRPADSVYVDESKARQDAQERSSKDPNRAIAVWEEDELLVVYLRGYELVPIHD